MQGLAPAKGSFLYGQRIAFVMRLEFCCQDLNKSGTNLNIDISTMVKLQTSSWVQDLSNSYKWLQWYKQDVLAVQSLVAQDESLHCQRNQVFLTRLYQIRNQHQHWYLNKAIHKTIRQLCQRILVGYVLNKPYAKHGSCKYFRRHFSTGASRA